MKMEIKDREIREITASTIEDGNNFEIKREKRQLKERDSRGKRCRPRLETEIEIMVEIKAGSGCWS